MAMAMAVRVVAPPPSIPASSFHLGISSSTQNPIFIQSFPHNKPTCSLLPCAATAGVPSQLEPLRPRSELDPAPTYEDLRIGSPVVIVQAPPLLKTAEPMPMMRPNTGVIKLGDAGSAG
eukprot:c23444_g1_i1 orf=864-1220(-)